MIISHAHKFIFVKTKKTAGTSIEIFLAPHCGPDDVLTPIDPPDPRHTAQNDDGFGPHFAARKIRSLVGPDLWNEYTTFCVDRNPWDKMVSHYYAFNARKAGGSLTFDDFIESGKGPFNFDKYTDAQDNVIVDHVLKYEDLPDALDQILTPRGIPPFRGVHAKSEYRTNRAPYQEHYTPQQAAAIEQLFAKEIALHGYTFNPSP